MSGYSDATIWVIVAVLAIAVALFHRREVG